jgi:hypothetical protein
VANLGALGEVKIIIVEFFVDDFRRSSCRCDICRNKSRRTSLITMKGDEVNEYRIEMLSDGERVDFGPDATSPIEGVRQAYDNLDNPEILSAWSIDRAQTFTAKGDPRSTAQRIGDFFKNRKYVKDLFQDRPAQIPIFHVSAVKGASAVGTYTLNQTDKKAASLKILGSGGGAGFTTSLTRSIGFKAPDPQHMRSLVCNVLVNATLFDHSGRNEVVTDIRPADDAFVVVLSGLGPLGGKAANPIFGLRDAGSSGLTSCTCGAAQTFDWNVGLGIDTAIQGVSINAGLSYEASRENSVEVAYELPNGADYYAYSWPTGQSLVPRIDL